MNDLEVSVDDLVDASVYVSNTADSVSELVSVLAHDVEVTIDEWEGAAADAFAAGWADWKDAAAAIVAALHHSAELLDNAGRSYGVTDTGSAHTVAAASGLRL